MKHRVCPWWVGYWLLCPLRHYWHDPREITAPYIREGYTVLEPGPGMGYFTLEMARLVGASGRVVAVDVQPKMIARLKQRAQEAGLLDRMELRIAASESMGIGHLHSSIDFTLAFAVVHEFPSAERFFAEVAAASKPGALLLLAEPAGHVKDAAFASQLEVAAAVGFKVVSQPTIRHSQAALLQRN